MVQQGNLEPKVMRAHTRAWILRLVQQGNLEPFVEEASSNGSGAWRLVQQGNLEPGVDATHQCTTGIPSEEAELRPALNTASARSVQLGHLDPAVAALPTSAEGTPQLANTSMAPGRSLPLAYPPA